MARRQLTYTDLRVALFVLATVVLLLVGIFYVTGQGAFQSKYTLKTYLPEAEGLVAGAPVSLGGVQVGSVTDLRINPNAATPAQNIEVDMQIATGFQKWIRANSTATLVTQGALGSRYVTITRGTPPAAVVPNGGSVVGVPASSIQTVVNDASNLLENQLDPVIVDLRGVADQVHAGKGTIGELIYSDKLANQLSTAVTNLNAIATGLREGQGAMGKLLASDALYDQATGAIGRADAILTAVQQQKGTLGKVIYDPAFYNNANGFLTKGNALLTGAEAGKGTLGQFVTNRSLFDNLNAASVNLRELTGKLDNGQGSMGKFFTDPQLYDNLTGLTGDMRLLMGDVRRNPKKYLRIKLTLF
jgi:phospholipid/cholesterol/gamma-HCH transport system substrate-binding protein